MQFKPFQIFTYQFIHDKQDIMHLFFNMLGLFIFGSKLEQVWGSRKYLFFYLFCVAGAAIFIQAVDSFNVYKETGFLMPRGKISEISSNIYQIYGRTTIGASGAIIALMAAFALLFPNTELMIMFLPIPIKAKFIALGICLIEVYKGFISPANDHISHTGHIGGFLFGIILVMYWNKTDRKSFF
jgi:membrane associated rhomboid family serine protease